MHKFGSFKTTFTRRLAIISVCVLFIFFIIVGVQAFVTRDVALERGKNIAERLTRIHADHIELTFNSVDLILRGVSNRYYYNSLFGRDLTADVEEDLKKWVSDSSQIGWIMLTNSSGEAAVTTGKKKYKEWMESKADISKEDFFKSLNEDSSNNRLSISLTRTGSNPENSDGTKNEAQNVIVLSRPVYNFDGSFGGVIAAAVESEYFFHFFNSLEIGENVALSIMINNGELVISESPVLQPLTASKVIRGMPKIAEKIQHQIVSLFFESNSKSYIISLRELDNLPVVIGLAIDETEILSNWRADRMTDIIFLVLFAVFGAVLFVLVLAMARQIQRAEESEKKALLANQAKSEFLAKMSHELRTPLNAIIGFSEMIDSGYFGPLSNKKQQERVHDINLCGNHLLQLINDILDYSKGEAGKLELREAEMSVFRMVDECSRMLREKAKQKEVKIHNDVPNDLPGAFADERKLKQVMINLISNAIKFTDRGKGEIHLNAKLIRNVGIEITVTDNGIGMNEDDIPTALSVFGQVHNAAEPEEEGTGLGLPLCKMLVELHGGKFSLESQVGVGTTARFTLPKERIIENK